MKRQIGLWIIFFCLFVLPVSAAVQSYENYENGLVGNHRLYPVNPAMKVLLEKNVDSVFIEVKGQYRVYNPLNNRLFNHGLFGKGYPVLPTGEGIKWGEEFPDVYQITIVPGPKSTISVNGVCYPGSVTVYQVGSRLNVVNEVLVEDYLKLILPGQLKPCIHDEVVAAVVIAARTNAYYTILRAPCAYWYVQAQAVGYRGDNGLQSRQVEMAVNATRYLVMQTANPTDQGLFAAMWTEHSAGQTAAPQVIFRKECGWSEGTTCDAALAGRESSRWSFFLSRAQFAQLVGLEDVKEVLPFKDATSNKVYAVRVESDGQTKDFDFLAFQQLLGKERLQSSDFTVTLQGESVVFTGCGQGHGVGVCLFTAEDMARHGKDAVAILRTFFPRGKVVMMPRLCRPR